MVGPLVANVGWGLVGPNNEEGIARLEIEQNVHFPFPFLQFVFIENAVAASGLGREKRLPRAGHAGIVSRTFPVVCALMSAAPASSVEAGGPWMAGSGQPAAILPARRPPFPFPWVVAGSSAPPVTIHRSQSARAPSFRWIVRWCLLLLLLVLGADAPGHCHCHCLDAPTVLVQWQNSPRLSHSSFHPFITADPTPWTLRRRWDASALFISHEPAKPPPSSQRSSPAEPQPARANPRPERFSSFPAAACPIDDCSFEPHPSSLRSSLSSLPPLSLPAHKSPIPQGASFASGLQVVHPPHQPTKTFSYDSEDVGLSATRRRKEGLTHLVSSHLGCLARPRPRPHRGNHKQTLDPCPTTGLVDSTLIGRWWWWSLCPRSTTAPRLPLRLGTAPPGLLQGRLPPPRPPRPPPLLAVARWTH